MSAVKGVQRTKYDTPISTNIIDIVQDNKVFCMNDSYAASALASGSTITVGKTLPAGAQIIRVEVYHDNLGSSTALSVGDSTTADRYIAAGATTSAGVKTGPDAIAGSQYTIGTATDDGIILITTSGGGAATGNIEIAIWYKMNSAA